MITSISKELYPVEIPSFEGEIKMLPFSLETLAEVPEQFRALCAKMTEFLPLKQGTAFLTVDGREVKANTTHRRGGAHVDGNYLKPGDWNKGGWKVGEGGQTLNSEEHRQSYCSQTGGMVIASTYPACKGWNGCFDGEPNEGGDCTHLQGLGEGFLLKPNTAYYGNSQFVHESLPLDRTVRRVIARITLPTHYPVVE